MIIPGYALTEQIFKEAERLHPDLMEPYSSRLGDDLDAAERQHIMRQGLAETFRRRHPMPPGGKWWDERAKTEVVNA